MIIIKTLAVNIKIATATTEPAKIWVSVIITQDYQCSSPIFLHNFGENLQLLDSFDVGGVTVM